MRMLQALRQKLRIRTKIILIYISVFIISLILTVGIFNLINEKNMEKEVGGVAVQTLNALSGNLDFIFENVTQFSNLIYFDETIQKSLKNARSENIDPVIQRNIQKSIVNMLLSGDYISSVFIFDHYNNYYYTYKTGPILVNKKIIKKTNWYKELQQANGNVFFYHKSENVLSFPTKKDCNYITLFREIGDVDTYEPIATLMITIDDTTIQQYFDEVGKEYHSQFYIMDSAGNYIIKSSEYEKSMDSYLIKGVENGEGYRVVETGEEKLIVVQKELGIQDWKLIGAIPLTAGSFSVGKIYGSWIGLIVILNLMFVFVCSLVLTKLIFKPLYKVQKHMKLVEDGQLLEMPLETEKKDEITDLKKVFNQMVASLKELIAKVKQEEKIITKNELRIIQAQVNPHFLYNTLDAVSALALLGDSESCFKMTQALGNFYRNSLNSGQELVTVKDEIACIESYITILNIRYDDKIIVCYDIETEIMDVKILKLILQPIVENAVHHGIRNKKGKGNIQIKGYRDEDEVIFCILDDGLGMSEDRINEILQGKTKVDKSGFGLYSSMQRISLFYDIEKPITITSEIENGTEITIRVKMPKEGVVNEN